MLDIPINYLAVIAAAVMNIVVASLWYGPFLGKQWMKLSGMTSEKLAEAKKKGMGASYGIALGASLVMAYVLSALVGSLGATAAPEGAKIAFWVWLGFLATSQLDVVLWEKRPKELYLINTTYRLVSLVLMGALLAAWK